MSKKTLLFMGSLGAWCFLIFGLIKLAQLPAVKNLRENLRNKTSIKSKNLTANWSNLRRRPLTTIELEENLKAALKEPFATYNDSDWKWFWDLIYARHSLDGSGGAKRQLSKQEIENILSDYYFRPFASFHERQWGIFWQHILKGRVFK